jgi:hypothetical protein
MLLLSRPRDRRGGERHCRQRAHERDRETRRLLAALECIPLQLEAPAEFDLTGRVAADERAPYSATPNAPIL